MAWYQDRWWYVERPFPIVPILAVGIPIALIVLAIVLGIWWYS